MRIRPRQYVYVAAILGLALFHAARFYRARHAAVLQVQTSHVSVARGTSPVWAQFDAAAAARGAPGETFQPALAALTSALAAPANTAPDDLQSLQSCRLWLLFNRQEVLHPDNRAAWKAQTIEHTNFCAANHADFAQ